MASTLNPSGGLILASMAVKIAETQQAQQTQQGNPQWTRPDDAQRHARQIARQFASGLAKTLDALPEDEVQELVSQVVRNRVRAFRVAPALGKTLALALADNRQEELLNAAVRLAADAVRNNREVIRERVRQETPWWVPPVLDDAIYQKIIAAVERLLHDMVNDAGHPLRGSFDKAIRDFIDR